MLAAASLVETTAHQRYRMHDLVRLDARGRAASEEPPAGDRALVERVVTHYVVLTAFGDRALRRDRLAGYARPGAALADSTVSTEPTTAVEGPSNEAMTQPTPLRRPTRFGLSGPATPRRT